MPDTLDELQAQRELVKRHLDWLDACIARRKSAASGPAPVEPVVPADTPRENAESPSLPELTPDHILSAYAGEERGLSPSTKTGCIFAAILVILLLLFTLFGLPYLLYKDKQAPANEPAATESGI